MEIRGICEYGPFSHGCASEIIETRERMGLGRLHEEVHMRAPATTSAKPLVLRPLRARTAFVFPLLALTVGSDMFAAKRHFRVAANDACLMPVFRDFT